jgi:hypothetical protein
MKGTARLALILVVSMLAMTQPVLGFEYPLSGTAIRAAFLTGNENNDRTTEFFLKYAHSLPAPASGPHVAIISLRTPYEQVAERGATVTNYHAQEAEQEFMGKSMPFFVRVQIDFTATYPAYPAPQPGGAQSLLQPLPDVERDFQIKVVQGKEISPKSTHSYLAYSDEFDNQSSMIFGAAGVIIEQEFDPDKIDSADMTIKVHTPDGQDVETTFDLGQLQ